MSSLVNDLEEKVRITDNPKLDSNEEEEFYDAKDNIENNVTHSINEDKDMSYKRKQDHTTSVGDDENYVENNFKSNINSNDENITQIYNHAKDIKLSLVAKEEGNIYFRNKEYDDAIESYSKAIYYCPEDELNKENLATFYGNRSAAYFTIEEYDQVIEDCSSALELKGDYIKVIFRRMQAYEKLDKIEEALNDAKKINELDSSYPKIKSI
eukprot:gene6536-8980_t